MRLGYDTSLFTGPAVNPRWEPSYVPDDVVSPISPLWVDEGRERTGLADRSADPAAAAAQVFADALRRRGITVVGKPSAGPADRRTRRTSPRCRAPRSRRSSSTSLEVSDNEGAEVLARQVALAEGQPASFAGGARAVRAVLTRLGVDLTGRPDLRRQRPVPPGPAHARRRCCR